MSDRVLEIVRDGFLELTLCFEAIFLIYGADDELVKEIVSSMEEIYKEIKTRLMEIEKGESQKESSISLKSTTYPSIKRFLRKLSENTESDLSCGKGEKDEGGSAR